MDLTDGIVTLREPIADDASTIASHVRSSLTELTHFMPWATHDYDAQSALAWITGAIAPDEQRFVITIDDSIVGGCGLGINQLNRIANLGYWVASAHTMRGIATAATRLLARHGLDDLGLGRIEIVMSIDNLASRRVAEKAGATYEATLRNRILLDGRYHDAHVFSFTPDDRDRL